MTKTKNNKRVSASSYKILAEYKRKARELERIRQQQLSELWPPADQRLPVGVAYCSEHE